MHQVIRALIVLLSGLSAVSATSCGPAEPKLAPLTSPVRADRAGASVTIIAKVRDLRPAVMRSLPSIEFAPLTEHASPEEGFLEIEIVGILGEPGSVRMEFEQTNGSLKALREPREITILVSVGRFGDAKREKQLAERVAREALTLGEAEAVPAR